MNLTTLILLALKSSIFLTVFALGLNASPKDTTYLFRNPGQLVRSLLPMYIIMPLVAAAFIAAFDIHPAVKIALAALAVSPIPPLLPKKQLKAGGEGSYTIRLLVAMSLFGVVFIPMTIKLFERAFKTPAQMTPAAVAQIVLVTVLVLLAIGIAVRYVLPELAQRLVKPILLVATVLLVSVIPILFAAWPAVASLIGNGTIAVIAAFILVGLAAGHLFGGPDRIVLSWRCLPLPGTPELRSRSPAPTSRSRSLHSPRSCCTCW